MKRAISSLIALVMAPIPALAQPEPAPEPDQPTDEERASFGQVLDVMELSTSWSAYADLLAQWSADQGFTFDATHFNPILGARLEPQLWAEMELEFESGGETIRMEYAFLDYAPGPVTLRLGRMLVPIGDFNERLHPSFRWPQISRPLMFEAVIPGVWSDIGVQLFGDLGETSRFNFNAYLVNGLGGDYDPTNPSSLRTLRDNYIDNNGSPGGGLRLGTSLFPSAYVGRTSLSISAYTGALNNNSSSWYSVTDASIRSNLGPVKLLFEAASSFLDEGDGSRPHQIGVYALPTLKTGKFTTGVRWDYVQALDDGVSSQQVAASVMFAAKTFWNLRAEVIQPFTEGTPDALGVSTMSSFFF